jgi:hypothetical protein
VENQSERSLREGGKATAKRRYGDGVDAAFERSLTKARSTRADTGYPFQAVPGRNLEPKERTY